MESRMPIRSLPLAQAPMIAAKAPANIMPSMPTAKTPANSERMPPRAASMSGVAMRMAAAIKSVIGGGRSCKHEQHCQSLDDHHERRRHAYLPLHRERTGFKQTDEERRWHDCQ